MMFWRTAIINALYSSVDERCCSTVWVEVNDVHFVLAAPVVIHQCTVQNE